METTSCCCRRWRGAAASANFPLLLLSPFWRRFNTTGAIAGLTTGLASIGLILAGPTVTRIDSPETNHHLIQARPWYRSERAAKLQELRSEAPC